VKVMIIAHGHPSLSPGGGERAAYALFEHLKGRQEIENPIFVARSGHESIGHSAPLGAFRGRDNEILASPMPCHSFTHRTEDYALLEKIVFDLIDRYSPDVVHVHHFVFWGVELFEILRKRGVTILLTLHEYMAICHRHGQMLKTNGRLCSIATAAECSACFPEYPPGHFFLRERIIKAFLEYVDHFISPSRFLADRYATWGIPKHKISVIENPLSPDLLDQAAGLLNPSEERIDLGDSGIDRKAAIIGASPKESYRIRIGFFGQINPYKGLDVLFEAISLLSADERQRIFVGLHGARLESQNEEFRTRFSSLLEKVADSVVLHGPYDNGSVLSLMHQYDWIVVPSIWWENSPVVIQEALLIGKPILCSRIGGIEEKAAGHDNVLLFEAGNAVDLAYKLRKLATPSATVAIPGGHDAKAYVDTILKCYGSGAPAEQIRPRRTTRVRSAAARSKGARF
jgi:glycosyltransferase involved in cell wall biosynthesis